MDDNDSVIAVTEENQDELSVIDDFSLVSRKRCRKPNKKYGYSSPTRKKTSNLTEKFSVKVRVGALRESLRPLRNPFPPKTKKSIMKGLIWNCRGIKKKKVSPPFLEA